MNDPSDVVPTPESPHYRNVPVASPLDEDVGPIGLHQEINERRARIENAELLQQLRSL